MKGKEVRFWSAHGCAEFAEAEIYLRGRSAGGEGHFDGDLLLPSGSSVESADHQFYGRG